MTPVGERTWRGQARKRCPTFSQEWREPWRNMFPCLHRELCTGIQRQRSVHKKKSAQRLEYWRIIIHVSGFQKEDETCEWGRGCTSRVDWQEGRTERGETKEERTNQTRGPAAALTEDQMVSFLHACKERLAPFYRLLVSIMFVTAGRVRSEILRKSSKTKTDFSICEYTWKNVSYSENSWNWKK